MNTKRITPQIHHLALATGLFIGLFAALPTRAGQVIPYTNDAYTVLLDHFDGSTSASILAYTNNGAPCGNPRPAAAPNYSYGPGAPGLSQALALYPPASDPNARSYLKYPGGELLCQPNGTIECWIYLTNYDFNFHQYNYFGECQGDVGGIHVNPTGQLTTSIWYSLSSWFALDSGAYIVPLNAWTHVALSWGSAGARLYMNGVLVGSNANTGSITSWFGQDSVFVSGTGNKVDELRISSIQRTNFNLSIPDKPALDIHMYAGLNITGTVGAMYEIQYAASPSSTNWQPLTDIVLPASPYLFFDTNSPSAPHRFYRVIPQP